MLPNFLVAGAQKCGTTSLHEYLYAHPDIYLPKIKETHFFADPEKYINGIEYYEEEFFGGWRNERAIGEVDPDYIYIPEALTRIAEHLDVSNLKVVLLVRNPVDRAFSHYLMTFRRGVENYSFEKALELESSRISKGFYEREHFSYLDRGFYGRDVDRLLSVVSKDNLLVLKSDDLKKRPADCLKSVTDFIGVNSDYKCESINKRYHEATMPRYVGINRWLIGKSNLKNYFKAALPSKKLRKMLRRSIFEMNAKKNNLKLTNETRDILRSTYREDIMLLQDSTGINFKEWL